MCTNNDIGLLLKVIFSEAYCLKVKSIRAVLNLALYMNLFVDCRGSDRAWGGPSVAKEESHCLCWNHCQFFVVNVNDRDRVITANIDINYQNARRNKDVKTVTICLLQATMAMHDSLRLLFTLALVDGVFSPGATWESLLAIDPGGIQY